MSAQTQIAGLLRDAKHIAEANSMVILGYLISMALLQLEQSTEGSKERVA